MTGNPEAAEEGAESSSSFYRSTKSFSENPDRAPLEPCEPPRPGWFAQVVPPEAAVYAMTHFWRDPDKASRYSGGSQHRLVPISRAARGLGVDRKITASPAQQSLRFEQPQSLTPVVLRPNDLTKFPSLRNKFRAGQRVESLLPQLVAATRKDFGNNDDRFYASPVSERRSPKLWPGVIQKTNNDGTYAILFDVGETGRRVRDSATGQMVQETGRPNCGARVVDFFIRPENGWVGREPDAAGAITNTEFLRHYPRTPSEVLSGTVDYALDVVLVCSGEEDKHREIEYTSKLKDWNREKAEANYAALLELKKEHLPWMLQSDMYARWVADKSAPKPDGETHMQIRELMAAQNGRITQQQLEVLLEDDWKDGSKGILKFISRAYAQPYIHGASRWWSQRAPRCVAWCFGARSHSAVWPAVRKVYERKLIPLGVEMVYVAGSDDDLWRKDYAACEIGNGVVVVATGVVSAGGCGVMAMQTEAERLAAGTTAADWVAGIAATPGAARPAAGTSGEGGDRGGDGCGAAASRLSLLQGIDGARLLKFVKNFRAALAQSPLNGRPVSFQTLLMIPGNFFRLHGLLFTPSCGFSDEEADRIVQWCRAHVDMAATVRSRLVGGSDRKMSSWRAFQLCNNRGVDRKLYASAEEAAAGAAAAEAKNGVVYPRVPDDVLLKVREYLGVGEEVPTIVFTVPGTNGDGLKISFVDYGADLLRQELCVDLPPDEIPANNARWMRGLSNSTLARAVGLHPGAELADGLRDVAQFTGAREQKQFRNCTTREVLKIPDAALRSISTASVDLLEALQHADWAASKRALLNGANPNAVHTYRTCRSQGGGGMDGTTCTSTGPFETREIFKPALTLALEASMSAERCGWNFNVDLKEFEKSQMEVVKSLLENGADPLAEGRHANDDGSGGYSSGGLQAVRRPIDIVRSWEQTPRPNPRHVIYCMSSKHITELKALVEAKAAKPSLPRTARAPKKTEREKTGGASQKEPAKGRRWPGARRWR